MRTLFLDIDTQLDFLFPAGGLYVPGAEHIVAQVARLNHHAPHLLSTADAHIEDDVEFKHYSPHCVIGTFGERKPQSTLRGQHIIKKRTVDAFLDTELSQLLTELAPERYVLYGVVTEICVKLAARGIFERSGKIDLVTDAVRELDPIGRDEFLKDFTSKGGRLITTAEVLAAT